MQLVSSDKKLANQIHQHQASLLEDDSRSMNAAFICREHANADYEKYCFTCHQLMCAKCVNNHAPKHQVKFLK